MESVLGTCRNGDLLEPELTGRNIPAEKPLLWSRNMFALTTQGQRRDKNRIKVRDCKQDRCSRLVEVCTYWFLVLRLEEPELWLLTGLAKF